MSFGEISTNGPAIVTFDSSAGKTCATPVVLISTENKENFADGGSQSRLNELATEAAKKVCEFNALIADVETRSRNQRVLLERLYDNKIIDSSSNHPETASASQPLPRPNKLELFTTAAAVVNHIPPVYAQHSIKLSNEVSFGKLNVDELPDFGPLSKKLKQNVVTQRRFSENSIFCSLPRTTSSNTSTTVVSSALASPNASRRVGYPNSETTPTTAKVVGEYNNYTVGGLVKLFSDVAMKSSPASGRKAPTANISATSQLPVPTVSPPGYRLVVRCPEDTVLSSENSGLPPDGRRLTFPDITLPVNPKRGVSPSFSNTFSFCRNLKFRHVDKAEKDAKNETDCQKSDTSQLERLLAGLNFSKFRITDRLGTGSAESSRTRSPSPRNGFPRSQQAAVTAAADAAAEKLGQQSQLSDFKLTADNLKDQSGHRLSISRTISQPAGLSEAVHGNLGNANISELSLFRKERCRVTLSEDRENTLLSSPKQCVGAMCRVTDDIAALITDIRQHFQLYKTRDHHHPTTDANTNYTTDLATLSAALYTPVDAHQTSPNNSDDSCGSRCPEPPGDPSRPDSEYVVSVVSDDYSESTGPPDETMDTESTSSSFIFSPTASSSTSRCFRTPVDSTKEISTVFSGMQAKREETIARNFCTVEQSPADNAYLPKNDFTGGNPTVSCYASVEACNSHKLVTTGRSSTFPPQTRKSSSALSCDRSMVQGAAPNAWDLDDPENRLSSASFPESAVSLTDSVYSTAGSSSLYSYMDHGDSTTQSSLSSEGERGTSEPKDRKPRYHSDPTPAVIDLPKPRVTLSSISEPVLPNSSDGQNGSKENQTFCTTAKPLSPVPVSLAQNILRESGGSQADGKAWLTSGECELKSPGETSLLRTGNGATTSEASLFPAAKTGPKGFHHDSFRALADKRLPRGPFGIRLEEDQIRRDRKGPRLQPVHDLSFLNSPEPSPNLSGEIIGENPHYRDELFVTGERLEMSKRRQSAQASKDENSARQYGGMKSSPDLFHNMNGAALNDSSDKMRPGEICRSASDAEASSWKKNNEDGDTITYSGSTESVPTLNCATPQTRPQVTKRTADFRTHIVRELYDTEKTYVETLIILEKYFETLKANEDIVEKALTENIFYQVPEIKLHHEKLLSALKKRMETWDGKQKIGDVIMDAFAQEALIATYTAFINNWKTAKEAIKLAKGTRPSFAKFLDQCRVEHRGKLNLDALLIQPVQRIPRYELLIKELLKHTPEDHPDRADLASSQSEVHDLALKINAMEAEVDEAERMMIRLKELEMYIDGLNDLVEPNRKFLKFDMVTMASGNMGLKKDRCLFLFSDLLVITNLKRKSGTIRKPSTNSPQLYPTLENNKYKLLMKIFLEDLELCKPMQSATKKPFVERDQLESDLTVLSKISELTGNLSASHQPLDEAVRNMMAVVSRQLSDKQAHAHDPNLSKLDLTVPTQHGLENISINFLSVSKRNAWERCFLDAKQAVGLTTDRRPAPDFLCSIPIRKTRAGMQITCSAATSDLNAHDFRDVWVCNSDGYVGQICVLSMQPEPALTSCITASSCKITCIASVPALTPLLKGSVMNSRNTSPVSDHSGSGDMGKPASLNLDLDSDDSSDEDASIDDHSRSLPSSDKDSFMLMSEDELSTKTHMPDVTQGTMWIGTEDGCILVYYCNDNIRMKKPRFKLQHSSAIQCIAYTDHTVFVGLGNGQVAMYNRTTQGFWETNHPTFLQLGASSVPVQRMTFACGKMWCACMNVIHVVNLSTLKVENSFAVVTDATRPVSCMVCSGLGVWISVQNSAVLRLCNAITYEFLADVNLTASVQKMLAGCDEILRQHKFACLRITALLSCKDLLWVGTSAGVILTISLPHIVPGMTKLTSSPTLTGIWHGHTGQIRFLHCVEHNLIAQPSSQPNNRRPTRRDRRLSINSTVLSKMLVVSGGDGYEDFRLTSHGSSSVSTDGAGRDDSTNHLLLWQC